MPNNTEPPPEPTGTNEHGENDNSQPPNNPPAPLNLRPQPQGAIDHVALPNALRLYFDLDERLAVIIAWILAWAVIVIPVYLHFSGGRDLPLFLLIMWAVFAEDE